MGYSAKMDAPAVARNSRTPLPAGQSWMVGNGDVSAAPRHGARLYFCWRLDMSWIITLIIGALVGWIASIIMKTNDQMGLIANILIGVVGSLLGFWIAGLFGLEPTGGIVRFLVGVAGAVLLIFILGKVGMFRNR
jgi:uncharacterized membrane protein YeaQ/YmgE (transglycosylase-associated protein family)